jgi:NAD(P)-dependent dehydrogenase (short-subunit alcohol dehydrogenase family)
VVEFGVSLPATLFLKRDWAGCIIVTIGLPDPRVELPTLGWEVHPREDYDRVMAINLRGVWSCMKFELQQMRKQGSRTIVNCSSLGGLVGSPERGIYHAAKHGVLGFTKSAALEYAARGIRINAVCPGLIHTPMSDQMIASGQADALKAMEKSIPMGRVGRPEEIANAVLWLCSDAASYVTGQSLCGRRLHHALRASSAFAGK